MPTDQGLPGPGPAGYRARMTTPQPDAQARNHAIYNDLWRHYELFPHEGWSAWPEIQPFAAGRRLEIGPGMFPHLPIAGTCFVDLSETALHALREKGGRCLRATSPLPFGDASFDVVCLFEVLEHVGDDHGLLAEIARVLAPGGVLFLSCPMNPAYFTYYDKVVGHERRYRAEELGEKLLAHGLRVERVCARHDRMDRWFGAVFGFGMRRLPRFTAGIVKHYLPKVAALPWTWQDGDALTEAETRGGVTLRARRV